MALYREVANRGSACHLVGAGIVEYYYAQLAPEIYAAYTNYYGGGGRYGGYRRGAWGWGGGSSNTTYTENDYIKGTLVMDVYDNETKNLIWQAVASGTVKENPKNRDKSIPKTVKKLMKKFPIVPVK